MPKPINNTNTNLSIPPYTMDLLHQGVGGTSGTTVSMDESALRAGTGTSSGQTISMLDMLDSTPASIITVQGGPQVLTDYRMVARTKNHTSAANQKIFTAFYTNNGNGAGQLDIITTGTSVTPTIQSAFRTNLKVYDTFGSIDADYSTTLSNHFVVYTAPDYSGLGGTKEGRVLIISENYTGTGAWGEQYVYGGNNQYGYFVQHGTAVSIWDNVVAITCRRIDGTNPYIAGVSFLRLSSVNPPQFPGGTSDWLGAEPNSIYELGTDINAGNFVAISRKGSTATNYPGQFMAAVFAGANTGIRCYHNLFGSGGTVSGSAWDYTVSPGGFSVEGPVALSPSYLAFAGKLGTGQNIITVCSTLDGATGSKGSVLGQIKINPVNSSYTNANGIYVVYPSVDHWNPENLTICDDRFLVVGAPQSDEGHFQSGKVWIFDLENPTVYDSTGNESYEDRFTDVVTGTDRTNANIGSTTFLTSDGRLVATAPGENKMFIRPLRPL